MFVVFSFFGNKGLLPDKIPQTKAELEKILMNKTQNTFKTDIFGYELYDFEHWFKEKDIYNFEYPQEAQFEPYYVSHRNIQLYDETYVNWGFNKITQIFDMNAVGYDMKVLPDVFMIHLNHSDIKGFKYWKGRYKYNERHQLKVGTSMNRIQKLPGLLTNTYYPPWFKNISNTFMPDNYSETQILYELENTINPIRSSIRMYKALLIILLSILVGLIVVIFRNNSLQRVKIDTYK